ncbi:hypothetical protein GM661_13120 [Iocasia frigidifontis]|uniref:Uncharacterized protein n=1 Tax=Iocasia fonsfrigidae TaxID=2682810 RepID=A0A8A7KL72_9FIRM|nr:hypothetical protein [Iocasia fonsfrigidae]QTL98834.1 hypothetical protein GM661_13120 [Iocasia fonsfrigidae]
MSISSKIISDKESIDLNEYKDLFVMTKDAAFITKSLERVSNVVPIHSKHILSKDQILITDQFMNKTKNNIIKEANAMLAIEDKNILYKISGKCKYENEGSYYEKAVQMVEEYAKTKAKNKKIKIKCKGIIIMDIKKIEKIQL